MPTQFVFQKGYVQLHAEFTEPIFGLFLPPIGQKLPEQLLTRLAAPYGVRLGNMKLDPADGDLGRANISCTLPESAASLRIGFERLELDCFFLERIGSDKLSSFAVDSAEALVAALGKDPFATYTVEVGLHGILTEFKVHEFLGRFFAVQPQQRGPLIGSGCVFYYGSSDDQRSSHISLDLSALVDGGLFVRKRTAWDASKVPLKALPDVVATRLDETLLELGLVRDEG